jgi:hypothetical protein
MTAATYPPSAPPWGSLRIFIKQSRFSELGCLIERVRERADAADDDLDHVVGVAGSVR